MNYYETILTHDQIDLVDDVVDIQSKCTTNDNFQILMANGNLHFSHQVFIPAVKLGIHLKFFKPWPDGFTVDFQYPSKFVPLNIVSANLSFNHDN